MGPDGDMVTVGVGTVEKFHITTSLFNMKHKNLHQRMTSKIMKYSNSTYTKNHSIRYKNYLNPISVT